MKKLLLALCAIALMTQTWATVKTYSTAGFYILEGAGRTVESMNPAWRFTKDPANTIRDAYKTNFDDKSWQAVSLPNGMEYLPVEASGGVNYRGASWYRKHFTLDNAYAGRRIVLHFEAIMGKCKVWVNGVQVAENFGGFLPVAADVTDYLKAGEPNTIAVWADNSDDPAYPPGKPQDVLDFCYFGGIYRDCWLISTNKNTYITDPNMVDKMAGGGLFVECANISTQSADIMMKLDLCGAGKVQYTLKDADGKIVAQTSKNQITLKNPHLWSPEHPYLYHMEVRITDKKGKVIDGYMQRIGIRSIKFSHTQGFILNGKPYARKLIGANRHQDFAVIGNALSNNLHWRDAQKLKEAGMEVIRNAHYPQDPAFMDACDELGLFVIENTPGWQFWNKEPIFEQRVYSDIRNIVRRDRNRPSVLLWEPILNETWYPEDFAKNVHDIVNQEIPGAYTASDLEARGNEFFEVIFTHPVIGDENGYGAGDRLDTNKVYFTREFGDNVDNWNSHNSPSRVARQWGEGPQLIQSKHYADPSYQYTSIQTLKETPAFHFGGTLWHSFDHQRGYHPDPFYGGIMDAFRRPKFSYFMFQAQANFIQPMVYIANEMTPFSPEDVTVFTNCASVRLHTYFGDTLRVKKREGCWITFEKAFNFMEDKKLSRSDRIQDSYIMAEGLDANGNVLATDKRTMSRRPVKINLVLDTMTVSPVANGGDLVVVVAQMVDNDGVVKRLNNNFVKFSIEGEGRLIGSDLLHSNPAPILWGEAPILVQTTTTPGRVTVHASVLLEGGNTPVSASVTFNTQKPVYNLVYSKQEAKQIGNNQQRVFNTSGSDLQEKNALLLKEVERQQEEFGEKK